MAPVCVKTTAMDMQLKKFRNISHVNMAVVKVIFSKSYGITAPRTFFTPIWHNKIHAHVCGEFSVYHVCLLFTVVNLNLIIK